MSLAEEPGAPSDWACLKRAAFPVGSQARYVRPPSPRDGQTVEILQHGDLVPEAAHVRFSDGVILVVGFEDLASDGRAAGEACDYEG